MSSAQRTLAALVLAVCWGCVQQHEGPQSSDTVTNWLRRCERQQDCTGAASCLNALCTVACDESRDDVCGEGQASLVCDTERRACDLPCQSARACDVLGAGYTCDAGRCRARVDVMGGPVVIFGETIAIDSRPSVGSAGGALTVREHATLPTPRATAFELSQPDYDSRYPDVTWTGMQFRVTWSESNMGEDKQLGSADISPAGDYRLRSFDLPGRAASNTVFGPQSALLLDALQGSDGGHLCSLQSLDLAAGRLGLALSFPCGGRLLAAPVESSNEWVLRWTRGFPPPGVQTEQIAVVRYRPDSGSWLDGPRTFDIPLVTGGGGESQVVVGSDVWFTFGKGTVYKIGGFAPPTRPDVAGSDPFGTDEIATFQEYGESGLRWWLWPLGDGVFVVRGSETLQLMSLIRSDGTQLPPTFESERVLPGFPSAASLPERAASALCFAGLGSVSVWLMSDDGVVGAPIVVDEDPAAVSCELAWSGEELLVAWTRLPSSGGNDHAKIVAKIVAIP